MVAGLHARTYAAFRRRRSLLLLDLQHQVRPAEVPWFAALSTLGGPRSPAAARRALRGVVPLTLGAFPQQVLPNPLVRELGALALAGDLRLALVEEVAADIFASTFTTKWRAAAQMAGESLRGSLYARYYDLPDPSAWDAAPEPRGRGWGRYVPRRGVRTAEDFAAACRARAVEAGRVEGAGRWSVAANGTVLEQSQVLTTHNLAVLTAGLGLRDELAERAPELVDRVTAWVLTTHARLPREHRAALTTVKNIAYAWRQGVYLLSLCDREQQDAVVQGLLDATTDGDARRLRPAAAGLAHVLAGGHLDAAGASPGGGRRLLGWSVGPHWLLQQRVPR